MPWDETTPMDQKTQFIADYLRGQDSMSELCDRYGISRKTGYKFVERYLRDGTVKLGGLRANEGVPGSRRCYAAYCSGIAIPEPVPVIDRQSSKRLCMISR